MLRNQKKCLSESFQVMAAMANLLSLALLFMISLSCTVTAQTPMPECRSCWCHSAGNCPDPKDSCPVVRNCKTAAVKEHRCYLELKSYPFFFHRLLSAFSPPSLYLIIVFQKSSFSFLIIKASVKNRKAGRVNTTTVNDKWIH